MKKTQIVIIGSADDMQQYDIAYAIGSFIAKNGWVLITGGRTGIMEAASKGAHDHAGLVVGILPCDRFDGANNYCDIVIPTGIGFARNSMNVLSADVVISIGGKAGTLTELAYAWHYGKPIISCVFTGGWSKRIVSEPIDDRNNGSSIYPAHSIEEVFAILGTLLNKPSTIQ
ncbi:MAG: TIGR00725 family protein [Spirochaetota bacterium]